MFWGRQHLKYSFLVQHILRLSRMRKEMYATCCGTVEERDINNEQRKKYDFCRLTLNHFNIRIVNTLQYFPMHNDCILYEIY